jgi:hypothetical protein
MPNFEILELRPDHGRWPKLAQNCESWIFLPSLWNFWTIEYHHALYWKYGTLAGLGSRPLAQVTMDSELITILSLRTFKWALICSIWTTGTRVMPGEGHIPGLLGHGPRIPDRTIDHCKATDLCWKFQLSRCYSGWEIGDGRTDGQTDRRTDGRTDDTTISVEPIFLKMCSKNPLSLFNGATCASLFIRNIGHLLYV